MLHVLLFFLIWGLVELQVFAEEYEDSKVNDSPLVFELQDIQRNRPTEVVETPEDAATEEFQKEAELASDKNALAQNSETDPDADLGEPFSRGDFQVRELPTNPMPQGEMGIPAENEASEERRPSTQDMLDARSSEAYARNEQFSREYLTNERTAEKVGVPQEKLSNVDFDNQASRAPLTGSFSFNTYEWEFAPYMLRLKKKVQRNIFPPPAFVRMGIISGQTLLRFKIYPNGEMRDLELLDYNGHKTLMETSLRAIEISAPYEELPSNFPEQYLEVTARFNYFIRKRR